MKRWKKCNGYLLIGDAAGMVRFTCPDTGLDDVERLHAEAQVNMMGQGAGAGTAPFLTLDEVAERYKLPTATLRYWRNHGKGPKAVKIGRYVRYRREDVVAWEREQFGEAA